jgi:hypothetical protein
MRADDAALIVTPPGRGRQTMTSGQGTPNAKLCARSVQDFRLMEDIFKASAKREAGQGPLIVAFFAWP